MGGESEKPTDNTVIVSPMFDFQCTNKGTFSHDSDCARFWLCTQPAGTTALTPQLFKCPPEYLYNDSTRRCVPEDQVDCNKTPDLSRTRLEPRPIQLRVSDLEAFFNLYGNF